MKRHKLLMAITLSTMVSVPTFATPIANFGATQPIADTVPTAFVDSTTATATETPTTIATIDTKATVSAVHPQLDAIYTKEYFNQVFATRKANHLNGTGVLPTRYLPPGYNNNMTNADLTGATDLYYFEALNGHPVFYVITRYQRPTTSDELLELGDGNDRINTGSSGLNVKSGIGTLTLN